MSGLTNNADRTALGLGRSECHLAMSPTSQRACGLSMLATRLTGSADSSGGRNDETTSKSDLLLTFGMTMVEMFCVRD